MARYSSNKIVDAPSARSNAMSKQEPAQATTASDVDASNLRRPCLPLEHALESLKAYVSGRNSQQEKLVATLPFLSNCSGNVYIALHSESQVSILASNGNDVYGVEQR